MADLDNVINISIIEPGAAVAPDSMNVTAIITSQADGPLNSANRYALYKTQADVAADFGSSSDAAAFASSFFGTSPNPVNAGGVLVMGYWRAVDENVAASAAVLTGAQLSEASVVPVAQTISDGAFDIDVDGTTVSVTGVDLRATTTLAEIVAAITVTGAVVSLSADNRIVITSATTGVLSLITVASDPGTGTYMGTLLGLGAGTGATTVQGAAASVLPAETKVDAIMALKAAVNVKGAMFIDAVSDADALLLAAWAQANSTLVYDVFNSASNLLVDVTNPVWTIKLAGQTNYRMLYSTAGNRKLAATYMARVHTVNFNADNSALTMHLKDLSEPAESYTQTELDNAKKVGLDVYTTFKGTVPKVITSGANDYVDNRYNLLAYIDQLQTDLFNVLGTVGTKVAQTLPGVNTLLDQGAKTARQYVRAGVFAPGEWSSPDSFGDLDTFKRNIREQGFYWLAGSLADQSPADRAARKSPVLQHAVKNAGAIHSADVIINFNL